MNQLTRCGAPVLMLAGALVSFYASAQQTPTINNSKPTPRSRFGQLPLSFQANKGQTDPRVQFMSQGNGYSVFLTSQGMVLALKPSTSTPDLASSSFGSSVSQMVPSKAKGSAAIAQPRAHVISLTLVNAAAQPVSVGENPQPGKANYFIGSDPSKWHTNVPMYGQVRYKSVYPGIDLVYYGNNRQVEYDFDIAAGADASQIKFQVNGADSMSIDGSGNLTMKAGSGTLQFNAPAIYQQVNGQRTPVAGSYQVSGKQIGFQVTAHDPSKPLVIDPVLVYSTYLGGRSTDSATGVGVDSTGNTYIVGQTQSPDFPLATSGSVPSTNGDPMFVAKMDVSGSNLLYADYLAGSKYGYATAIAVATDGTAYIAGYTQASDFPVTSNAFQSTNKTSNYNQTGTVSEISPDGSTLIYSTYLGGSTDEIPATIGLGVNGQFLVAGSTQSADFPVANAYQGTFPATPPNSYTPDVGFVTEFSADGTALIYSTFLSGTSFGTCQAYDDEECELTSPVGQMAVDGAGNAYVSGTTNDIDFPTTTGAYATAFPVQSPNGYRSSAYLAKFSSTGQLSYSTYFGPTGNNYYVSTTSLAVDSSGDAYLMGATDGGTVPSVAAGVCNSQNTAVCTTYFLTKFSSSGASLTFSTMLPTPHEGSISKMAIDGSGNIFLLGEEYLETGNTVTDTINPMESAAGNEDVYLSELDPSAATQPFVTLLGGVQNENATGLTIDSSGAVYIVGNTSSTDFPVIETSYQQTSGGSQDLFVMKIDPNTNAPAPAISPSLLQYPVRDVGAKTSAENALLRNMGTEPLLINSIKTSGDFTETDNCSPSVPAGGTCNFNVIFAPTAPGSRFGTILIEDNAVGSPHFINLSGVGSTPVVALSPASLSFGSLQANATSPAQTVTLTNNGNATLNIGSIAATGDFAETNNCAASIALGASCQVQVTFTPTTGGSRTGSLTFTDNAADSPETVALTGSGYVTTATISPTSLQFSSLQANSTSAAQTIAVTNTGENPMVISAMNVTGNFAQTSNCGTVAPSKSCTISVTFKPLASGSLTGMLTISDNANGNPHAITLTGTGVAPVVHLSTSSLTFASQSVGTKSTSQTIGVTNTGNGSLSFTSIVAQGDFTETNNCAASIAANGTCTVTVTFAPTASGARSGSVTFTDGAAGSPQTVALTGTATQGTLTPSPQTLSFPAEPIGTSSAAQMVTLTNTGTGPYVMNSMTALGAFSETSNCPASLAPGSSCTVSVVFTPQASGAASGAIAVNGATIPVSASGSGVDFAVTASSPTQSVAQGATATFSLSLASVGGTFPNAVQLSCAGAPGGSKCTVTPATVTPGASPTAFTATVSTVATTTTTKTSSLTKPGPWLAKPGGGPMLAYWVLRVNGLGLAFLIFGTRRGRRFRRTFLVMLIPLLFLGSLVIIGCGSSTKTVSTIKTTTVVDGTPSGSYAMTITATSGNLQHSMGITLQVQ